MHYLKIYDRSICFLVFSSWVSFLLLLGAVSSVNADDIVSKIINNNGRHALLVDGKPYLILGAQTNNSSNYPAALPDVWPVVERIHANTIVIPVAWEQIEPVEDQFDFSYLKVLLKETEKRNLRIVLLWFATWKNNAPHYAPAWVKLNNQRFPRVVSRKKTEDSGEFITDTLNSLSPHFRSTLDADKKAFVELMKFLKKNDRKQRVIMIQVQNEVGTYGSARDFSATANALFAEHIPESVSSQLGVKAGNWTDSFGDNADEFFHAYSIGQYVNEIAAAGKAIYPLPMYVNVALRDPFEPGKAGTYSSGGATDNVIDLWKIAAPDIDMVSPDIYMREHAKVSKILEYYARPDNPLYVSEIGNAQDYARYFFLTLGQQGLGFSPFGMDFTDYVKYPLGARVLNDDTLNYFSEVFGLFAPMATEWATISLQHPVWGFAELDQDRQQDKVASNNSDQENSAAIAHQETKDLGKWNVTVSYGRPMFWIDPPQGNAPPSGGAVIAALGEDEFLVTGFRSRIDFFPSSEISDAKFMYVRVEEGHFEHGDWVFERVWNGDQTDWGLNLGDGGHVLKVTLGTYQTH